MKFNYFNFKVIKDKVLLTNDFGYHIFVEKEEFLQIINKKIDGGSCLERKLLENKFIYDSSVLSFVNENFCKIREAKKYLGVATALHIFVVTTSCNMKCVYCQANNGKFDSNVMMDKKTAMKAVDIALQSPAKFLTFEFQGGEPLLNFEIIKFIVEYAEEHKKNHVINYSIVSNLLLTTDEILDFFETYDFCISTSLDGSNEIHNYNRMLKNGEGTFELLKQSIIKIRDRNLNVDAIQTTTKKSLKYPIQIVQAYKELGFHNIFLRPLTPLGKANTFWDNIGYSAIEFIEFYKQAMDEIISINKNGYYLKENHASIFLNKMNGNFQNYMELRSPCGAAFGQLAYYADGNIFTCDEARMIYEMGDNSFLIGNVYENSYTDLIKCDICNSVCKASVLETLPSCCDCVYQPYCGVCPIINYSVENDIIEKEPKNYKCKIYQGMLDYLFEKIENEESKEVEIFNSWIK